MLSSAVSGREFDRFALRGNGELLESLFFPDFRQKSHFRCLKGSEVQDFRAFLL